jgi:hypothetical protein
MPRFYTGKDDRTALDDLRAYVKFATKVAPHIETTSGSGASLNTRLREAHDRIVELKARVEKPTRWADLVEQAEEEALRKAVDDPDVLAGDPPAAEDDPSVVDVPIQDFGLGTSHRGSGTARKRVADVPSLSQLQGPSIGFLPPAGSSD